MTTVTWTVTGLRSIPAVDPEDKVLTRAYWCASATSGNFSAQRSNYVKLTIVKDRDGILVAPNIDPETYIRYHDITEQDVVSWVKEILGGEVAVIERSVLAELESQVNTVTPPRPDITPLPWE